MDFTKRHENTYLLEVDEYPVHNKIDKEPAFPWWVPYTLEKNVIIFKVKSKYCQRTHKYGICVLKSVDKAL